jgi:hypothetical protein
MRSRRAVRAGEGGTQELASSAWNSRICCGIAAASRAPAARLTRCDPEGRVSRGRRGSGASKFRVELADLSRDRSGFPCASGPADAMRSRGPGEPGKAGLRSWQVPRGTRGIAPVPLCASGSADAMRSRRAVRAGEGGAQEPASSAWNSLSRELALCAGGLATRSRGRASRQGPSGAGKFRVELDGAIWGIRRYRRAPACGRTRRGTVREESGSGASRLWPLSGTGPAGEFHGGSGDRQGGTPRGGSSGRSGIKLPTQGELPRFHVEL